MELGNLKDFIIQYLLREILGIDHILPMVLSKTITINGANSMQIWELRVHLELTNYL